MAVAYYTQKVNGVASSFILSLVTNLSSHSQLSRHGPQVVRQAGFNLSPNSDGIIAMTTTALNGRKLFWIFN